MLFSGLCISSLLMLAITGSASGVVTLTSTGCVDSKGMDDCANNASMAASQCVTAAGGDSGTIAGCGCALDITNINCYASHCWNHVYECEYQAYVSQYFTLCQSAKFPMPYFPAPDGAPDSCSCNLGNTLIGSSGSIEEVTTCQQSRSASEGLNGIVDLDTACECCGLSGAISSIYTLCPQTDPAIVGLAGVSEVEQLFGMSFTSCASTLSQTNCNSGLGFNSTIVGGKFFTPDDLPPNGTATLTNSPGTVTDPASGTVFTYTNLADSLVYTISAVNAPTGGGSGGNAPTGARSGGGSGGPTGTPQKSSTRKGLSSLGTWAEVSLVVGYTLVGLVFAV